MQMNFVSDFTFSEKSFFCEIQYGRCVRGCWRQMPFYTLLIQLLTTFDISDRAETDNISIEILDTFL